MPRLSLLAAAGAAMALALAAPAAGAATRPQPLVSVAPTATAFVDRVLSGGSPRAAGASTPTAYAAPDGQSVQVSFSPSYTPDPTTAQSYVNFLASMPHGAELSQLTIYIAPPAEVASACGSGDALACYAESTHTMTVPGEQITGQADGVTTSYVIAHEYGHHIAAFRSDAPFAALDYGPKYWASYEQVCLRTLDHRLFPGDEGRDYLENPGEAWADTYAHLTYPAVGWQFDPTLAPDAGAFAAARKDVLTPWTANVTKTFSGTFGRHSANARHFTFALTLDGTLKVTLKGPSATNYDLALVSRGKVQDRTSTAGSRDTISYPDGACRQDTPSEKVTLSVSRKKGVGPFAVKVSYAG